MSRQYEMVFWKKALLGIALGGTLFGLTGCAKEVEETATFVSESMEQLKSTAEDICDGTVLQQVATVSDNGGGSVEAMASDEAIGEALFDWKVLSGKERSADGESQQVCDDFELERENIGLTPETDALLLAAQEGYYAFSTLDTEEQKLYVDLVQILSEMAEDIRIRVPELDAAEEAKYLAHVFQCVMNDHPEFYYVDGYTYTRYTAAEKLVRITFRGSYTMSPAKRQRTQEGIDQYLEQVLAEIPVSASDYEKVKGVYTYVIQHTEYDQEAKENQNICSVFLYGRSICQGYAKAVQYLCQKLGIQATLVTGRVDEEGHAWDLVLVDGAYYYVDATWGDASYELQEDSKTKALDNPEAIRVPNINYDYLCVTTEQIEKTHQIDESIPMPLCRASDANYYQMEHAYFTGYDREHIKELFAKAYEQGAELVTLKCSDSTAYEEVKRMLLTAQEVFDFMENSGKSIAYSENDEQLSISFWL